MFIEDLVNDITPPLRPSEVPSHVNWSTIEAKMGTPLPQDYKWFVEVYGTGVMANAITVFNPFSKSEYLNLLTAGMTGCDLFRHVRSNEEARRFHTQSSPSRVDYTHGERTILAIIIYG